ncbi:enoyl-CoA hydratase/isomerase family protein [Arthrobacter sp. ISL-95]|uniref:enoyl-CoA hydratase/isomerase family protein n=1 Tax=Arthrobacter sp. ISL-95 TaxID=2819116 RepID=UPI001BEC71F1|nr:enoyl-CoA hydratase/isomerase family protein [Arthrobacter sp. ISL-95]MBT2587155.1 enoyl-CoA hydratase/isomerase family protein [Arthrobacter sp. ISL-95]
MTTETNDTTDELLTERRGSVLWLTLNRPKALNAITATMLDALVAAVEEGDRDPEVRAMVLTGSGRGFCAGADLKDSGKRTPEEGARFVKKIGELTSFIEASGTPVIAAINGIAVAGGLELVLSCDIVVAAESAVIGDSHSNFAMFPGAGVTVRLPRKIGLNNAKYLMFTGQTQTAREWVAYGLVNEVVADDELVGSVERLADTISSKSPLVLARMKQALNDSLDHPVSTGLRYERALSAAHSYSFDRVEGLSAFREKRVPQFEGR